jgi:hypothetical protein
LAGGVYSIFLCYNIIMSEDTNVTNIDPNYVRRVCCDGCTCVESHSSIPYPTPEPEQS